MWRDLCAAGVRNSNATCEGAGWVLGVRRWWLVWPRCERPARLRAARSVRRGFGRVRESLGGQLKINVQGQPDHLPSGHTCFFALVSAVADSLLLGLPTLMSRP